MTAVTQEKQSEKVTGWAIVKAIFRGLSIGVTVFAIIVAIAALVVPRVLNGVPLTVLSGSMVPTFKPGDLIITAPTDVKKLHRGDIITFQPKSGNPELITHRIVSVGTTLGGELVITTRGDANGADDKPIKEEQVMGKYLYHIPYLGYLANAVSFDDKAMLLKIIGGLILLYSLVQLVIYLIQRKRENRNGPTHSTGQSSTSD